MLLLLGAMLVTGSMGSVVFAEDFGSEEFQPSTDTVEWEWAEEAAPPEETNAGKIVNDEIEEGVFQSEEVSEDTEHSLEKVQADEPLAEEDVYDEGTSEDTFMENVEDTAAETEPVPSSLPAARDLTYTGEAQTLLEVDEDAHGIYLYSLDGMNYSEDIPTGTDAGEYIIHIRSVDAPDEEAFIVQAEVKKADILFTAPVPAS